MFYVLFLGLFVYRTLSVKAMIDAAGNAAVATSVIMLTVATSKIFAWLAVKENLGVYLTNAMLAVSHEVWALLLMINVLLLFLGMFMEILPIMLILAPILFPLLSNLGVEPVHFGVVMVLNLMIGMITPPVGLCLFIVSAIGRVSVDKVTRAALPMIAICIVVLMAVAFVPAVSLTLPMIFGR